MTLAEEKPKVKGNCRAGRSPGLVVMGERLWV